jgi:hypothetical protein
MFTGRILNDNKNTFFTILFYRVPWKKYIFLKLRLSTLLKRRMSVRKLVLFLAAKMLTSGHISEVATRRQLSNLSSSSRFLDVFFTIFIFEKNCSQKYVLPKRLVICRAWFLSTGNLSPGK